MLRQSLSSEENELKGREGDALVELQRSVQRRKRKGTTNEVVSKREWIDGKAMGTIVKLSGWKCAEQTERRQHQLQKQVEAKAEAERCNKRGNLRAQVLQGMKDEAAAAVSSDGE